MMMSRSNSNTSSIESSLSRKLKNNAPYINREAAIATATDAPNLEVKPITFPSRITPVLP